MSALHTDRTREEPEVLSVSEINSRIQRSLRQGFPSVWVEGEVASLSRPGHFYFSLKDERDDAVIRCVMFRTDQRRGGGHIADGARVMVRAVPTLFSPRGTLQLRVDAVKPAGRGSLLEALERLKQKLQAEGLFGGPKRELPSEPRVIGVVTSGQGAAIGDICRVAFRRGGAHIVLAPALVQGAGAPKSLCDALDLIERHPDLDVLIVGRGGGSKEDLMAFNDESVVRRVARCRVPVVSAVGHEIDSSLTDFAADHRAATPSQAAELVIPDATALAARLRSVRGQLLRATEAQMHRHAASLGALRARLGDPRYLISLRQQRVDELSHRLAQQGSRDVAARHRRLALAHGRLLAQHPRAVLESGRARLAPLTARLQAAAVAETSDRRLKLGALAAGLEALSPLSVLERGYAIATRRDGRVVRSPRDLRTGQRFTLRVAGGEIEARAVGDSSAQEELDFGE